MNDDRMAAPHYHYILPTDMAESERQVMSWFAAGHEILWIPIYEVANTPSGLAEAQAEAAHFGGPRLIRSVGHLLTLPLGINGWLFPAHLDDTDIICRHDTPGEISFGPLIHPITRQRLTYRYDTEVELGIGQ